MAEWKTKRTYDEILYETYNGIAKITINRPEVHNAFTPKTVAEMIDAFADARDESLISDRANRCFLQSTINISRLSAFSS